MNSLIEKLVEQDFSDTFKPASPEELNRRLVTLNHSQLFDTAMNYLRGLSVEEIVKVFEKWGMTDVSDVLMDHLMRKLDYLSHDQKIELIHDCVRAMEGEDLT
jgi:ribosomal protein L14E/L6E/L27E